MKNLKNLLKFSILLSLIFAMSVFINPNNVNAEGGENTITINNTNPGHVYNAYQIFAGIKSDNNLNKVTWGSGVSAEFKKSQEALAYAKKIEDRPNDIDTVTEDLANNLSDLLKIWQIIYLIHTRHPPMMILQKIITLLIWTLAIIC